MKLYIRYPNYALAVEAFVGEEPQIIPEKWLRLKKMYQLVTLPPELVESETERAYRIL